MKQDQYNEIKKKYPDAILLFRMGDFYEGYREDALKIRTDCKIQLTQKDGKFVAQIPYGDIDKVLPRLVRAGHRVALCEPITESKKVQQPKQLSLWA